MLVRLCAAFVNGCNIVVVPADVFLKSVRRHMQNAVGKPIHKITVVRHDEHSAVVAFECGFKCFA